ncbi:MAG: tRNA epoxyqueuosine(34) reductase QueG [Acidimicrobiales bacterium]
MPSLEFAHLANLASASGIDAFGATDASEFTDARQVIEQRKARGLHGGMWFTYGRPERSADPSRILPGAKTILVGALAYYRPQPPSPTEAKAPALVGRFVWQPFYDELAARLEVVASHLRAAGAQAVVVLDDNRLIDRAAAHRAGLGWFGKNTMLLLEGAGSWFVLGSIVTDAEVDVTTGEVPDGCGTCVRCQIACPTGALDTAGELDARRCLAWLLQADGVFPAEHRVALGARIYGCDDCQEVCPPNVRFIRSRDDSAQATPQQAWSDAVDMLNCTDDQLLESHGAWYIPRRRPEYLRRNALVVLANVADPQDPDIADVIERCLSSDQALVVAHAVWAAKRLGLDRLVDHIAAEVAADPIVQAELARHVDARR